MFARLSRTRVPFRRYIQTESFRSTSTTTKYAIAVGTVATVAFFGIQTTRADSGPSQHFKSPPPTLPPPTAENFESFLLKRIEENPSPKISTLRSTILGSEEVPQEPRRELVQSPTPSEPKPTPPVAQTDAEEAETSGDDSGGGAFNPETGEINWDCPCLGGMAQGPCGPQFREAFSCFVYSEDEPKGINCVEKFQAMQTCFREHPDVYASEIADDDEAAEAAETETETAEKEGSLPKPDNEVSASSADASESAPPPAPVAKPSEDLPSSQQ